MGRRRQEGALPEGASVLLVLLLAGCWIGPGSWSDWDLKHGEFDTAEVEGDADTDSVGDTDTDLDTVDDDGDGYSEAEGDCDDGNAAINPGATDMVGDDNDQNCDGVDGTDADGDGHAAEWSGGDDCDDEDDHTFAGAAEDESNTACMTDADEDGWGSEGREGTDCNDGDATINPGADETWYDGVDQNCDGLSDYDADGDGFDSNGHGGDDCNDTDADIFPGAHDEWYDKVDQDCDGYDYIEFMNVASGTDFSCALDTDGAVHCWEGARLELSLSPAFGLLQVSSTPAGAEVRLDGERVGTTPWKVERKKSGSYELSLALDDYLGHRETIEVRDGQPTSVSATLEPNFGGLVVHSSPAGARVMLDGKDSGELTPATFSTVKPGVTEVRLTLEGYGDVVQAAAVERRGTARLDLTLPPKLGLLSVMANGRDGAPCEGAVFLDGQQRGLTPLKLELPAREYALEVRCGKAVGKERVAVLHNERVSLTVDTGGVGDLDWVSIPGGSFSMGSSDEKPVHTVRVGSFEMARSEVTFGQYQACVDAGACTAPHVSDGTCYVKQGGSWKKGTLPSIFQGAEQPVVCVDWEQARAYARWVGGRLPTEAEWEYAARGGQSYTYAGSTTLGEVAWYSENSGGRTHDVCGKRQNGYGLCDMSGNVWEWVEDWYHSSYTGAPTDGSAWLSPAGSNRVFRGGSWSFVAWFVRVAFRDSNDPGNRDDNLGFRPVRD